MQYLLDISDKNGFILFKSYSSFPDLLVEHFESYGKINYPKFQVVEKHSDKYLIDENKASGILSRYSPFLGNSYGILTLYAIDKDSDLVLMFKFISDANNFIIDWISFCSSSDSSIVWTIGCFRTNDKPYAINSFSISK